MPIDSEDVKAEFKDAQRAAATGGRQLGGGPDASDQDGAGGSSGGGGYGKAQAQAPERDRSEEAGGPESDLAQDQRAHQDHGQGYIASEGERDTGAAPIGS